MANLSKQNVLHCSFVVELAENLQESALWDASQSISFLTRVSEPRFPKMESPTLMESSFWRWYPSCTVLKFTYSKSCENTQMSVLTFLLSSNDTFIVFQHLLSS